MKVDNSMTQTFLTSYPADASRVLELLPEKYAIALLNDLPVSLTTPVIKAMLPEKSAAVLASLDKSLASKIMAELPVSSMARIYRLLEPAQQESMSLLLDDKSKRVLQRFLTYPPSTAGALVDPCIDILPENITVSDAIRRVEHSSHVVMGDLYIINENFQLTGVIELGKLLISKHHLKLRDVMNRKTQSISVHANSSTLLAHPGWRKKSKLPVIERDKTIVGILDYRKLQEELGETGLSTVADPLDDMLSLVSLYWISMARLLDSLFNVSRTGRER